MDFNPHMKTIFATRGAAAIYSPVAGDPISCKAIRQGGGQPVKIGPVLVTTERISFHVLRSDIPTPVTGSLLTYRGEPFTIDACQPVERDADGLLWSLDTSWGAQLGYRSVSGAGASQNPPQGAGFTVSADMLAGATAISIKSSFTVGKLFAGDKLIIGSNVHTVTGSGVQAVANQFPLVPFTPALPANVAAGAAVTMAYARDLAVRGAVASYAANELMGGVVAGDRRFVIMQAALAGMGDIPKTADKVTFEGRVFNVVSAAAIYQGVNPVAWDIQARG